jgi:Right handed beta helix region
VSIEGDGVTSIIKSTATADFSAIIMAASAAEGTNGNQHISKLKFDGQNLATSIAITVKARNNFSVYDCSFADFKFSAITMSGFTSLFSEQYAPATYATSNKIYNNNITNCAGFNEWSGGAIYGSGSLYVVGQKDMQIYNNTIVNISRPDGKNGWPIKATDWSQGMKIYNNVLTRKAFPYTTNGTGDYWDFAIEMGDVQGLEIYGNTIKGSVDVNRNSPGAYAYSVYIHDNVIGNTTLTANHECGIILEYNTDKAIIEKNTIQNCADAIVFSVRPGGHTNDITITRNLIKGVGSIGGGYGRGIGYYGGGTYSADAVNIYNNTIVAASQGNAPFWGVDFAQPTNFNKLNFKNNIVKDFNYGGAALVARNLAGFTNSSIQYNNFNNNSSADDPFPSWVEPISNLSTSSVYSNTVKVNPMFVSNTNFALQSASPLVDAGINVGLPLLGTRPDIGYAELR